MITVDFNISTLMSTMVLKQVKPKTRSEKIKNELKKIKKINTDLRKRENNLR